MAKRLLLIVFSCVGLLVVLAGGALAWLAFFPDTLKPPLERLLSAQLGQEVRIQGPLKVELGRVTVVELNGVHVAAPEWAEADDLAAVDKLRVGVDLVGYLRDRTIRITELRAKAPTVALERDAQGRTSWPTPATNAKPKSEPADPVKLPRIELLAIEDGQVAYRDAINDVETTATIATRSETDGGLAVSGTGSVRGDPLAFQLTAGSPEQVTKGTEPLPIRGEFTLAGTRATVDGVLRDPVAFGGLDLAIDIASEDPGPLLNLAGRPSKDTLPALSAGARLTKDANSIDLEDLRASWGETQIEGRAQLDTSGSRPHVDAELRAPVLDLVQLSQMVGADGAEPAQAAPSATDPGSAQATSAAGNPLKALAEYEGELRIAANTIRVQPDMALTDATATLNLADGRLRIAPLRIGLPTGNLAGEITTGPLGAEQLTVDLHLQAENAGVADLAGYGGRVDGVLEGTLLVGPPQAILAGSQLRFEGHGDGLKIPGADLGSLTVTATLEDGHLSLDPLQAKLPQGEIAGRVMAGPFDHDFSAEFDLDAAKVDLAAAARSDLIGGLLDGHVTGSLHGATPRELMTRSQLQLDGTIAELRLPQLERPLTRVKLAVNLDPSQREALHISADASADDRPLQLSVFGGSVESIAENRGDYPFTVHSELGKNTVDINGTVSLPLTERKFAATVKAEGPDPSPILALFELPKLQIPPYRVSGVLTNRGDELRIKGLDGRVGDSDVAADLTVSFGGERPKLSGQVTSKLLDADDLGGLVGAQPGTGPGETASPGQKSEAGGEKRKGTVLPDERLEPARWRKGDVDLALRVDEIHAGKIPLDGFTGQLTLVDGLLRLEPLDLRVGDGHLTGRIEIDGRRNPVGADVDLDMKRLSVARLMRRLDVDLASFGTLSGSARGGVGIGGTGYSIKDILAKSNGEIRLVMEGGQIDRTIVAGLGLDLLRLFGSFIGATPEMVELRCTVADLKVRDGIVTTSPLIIDTAIAQLGGEGTIDLKHEAIDISLTARPVQTPLPTDLTGISISGTLAQPQLDINPLALAARGVAAATLGVLLKPFTAVADAAADAKPPCAALLDQAPGESGG